MGTSRTTPAWKVQVVSDDVCCDDCCGGGDPAPRTPRDESPGAFAYTIGLHERGAPELHLWARPTEGDDPGLDWCFSPQDLVQTLNELAEEVLAGRLEAGGSRTEAYDGGEATVTFRLGTAVDRMDVDAFRVDPAAAVMPVGWSLVRSPVGTPGPADLAAVHDVQGLLLGLTPRPSEAALLPAGWRCDDLDFDPGGDFGPMTPLVRGLAAAVVGGEPSQLARFLLDCASGYSVGLTAGHVLVLAEAAARRVGRGPAVARVREAVPELTSAAEGRTDWPAVLGATLESMGGPWPSAEQHLVVLLRQGLLALLGTAVVHDVAEGDLLHGGMGPYWWSRRAEPGVPPELGAPPGVLRGVARTVRHLGPGDLGRLLSAHDRACLDDDYRTAAAYLQGLRIVSPVALGSLDEVLSPAVVARVVGTATAGAAHELLGLFVAAAGAAASGRGGLSDEAAEAFCAPYDDLVPDLRSLLDLGPHCRP